MKKVVIGISVFIFIIFVIVYFLRYTENRLYKEEGNELIEKIEEYKNEYGMLPQSISDINVKAEMGVGPYYEKLDSTSYIINFNIGFDNTLIYHSKSGEWKEYP